VCASTDDDGGGGGGDGVPAGGITHWTLGTGGRRLSGVDGLHKQPHWVEAALSEWGHLRLAAAGERCDWLLIAHTGESARATAPERPGRGEQSHGPRRNALATLHRDH
jgi:hypothetical protein